VRELEAMPGIGGPAVEDEAFGDDRLALLFMCCHPALPLAGRVALTLKTVTGLSTREVARAFVVTEATMSKRLLRTKQKIENAGISFRLPPAHRLAERTGGVLAVVYLLFNEGYAATEGTTLRPDLASEAVRLAGLLTALLPDDDEVAGLHALLLLQHSRRDARAGDHGELLTMEEQDRGRWDRALIEQGLAELDRAREHARPAGPYRLQAEIAARHATAATAAETDWATIVGLYDALLEAPNPVVALNRAVAIGFRDGPDAGLVALDEVDLPSYHLVAAARADFLRRAGRPREAAVAYRAALELVGTDAERRLLERRLAAVGG
jgi:RNA polymerase sigma-70 factor (ECF subfamily)